MTNWQYRARNVQTFATGEARQMIELAAALYGFLLEDGETISAREFGNRIFSFEAKRAGTHVTCSQCDGSGKFTSNAPLRDNECPNCHGLGVV